MDINYVIPPALRPHAQAIISGVSFAKDALKMTDVRQVNKLFGDVIKNIQTGSIKPTISSIGRYATGLSTLAMDMLPTTKIAKIPAKGIMDLTSVAQKGLAKKSVDDLIAADKKIARTESRTRGIRKKKPIRKLHIETKEADKMTAEQKLYTYGTNKDFVTAGNRKVPIEQTILIETRHPITNKLQRQYKLKKGYELTSIANKNKAALISPNLPGTRKEILTPQNPDLTRKTGFIAEGSDTPIKHLKGLTTEVTDRKGVDYLRTKIVQAHGIGEGGLKLPTQYVTKKVNMIPDKFLEEVKLPKFFLTEKMNKRHSFLEDGLIQNLVKKYNILGYDVIGKGKWSKPAAKVKLNKVQRQELAAIKKNIKAYQREISDINSYVQFYNPVTDKLVTHGKHLSEIPGLVSVITKAKRQPGLFLADGGPAVEEEVVDIFEDPVYEDVDEIDYKEEQAKMKGKKFDIGKSTPLNVADDLYQRRMDQSALLHKITGQPIEDIAKHFEDKYLDESNYSDTTQSYIRSRENYRSYEDQYQERSLKDIQETGFIRPETKEWYDNLKNDQTYKDMTATLFEPQFQEARNSAQKEIFTNQMKGHSWDMVDKVMDVYQAFNPFALAALPHKLRYDQQIEDFEHTYEMLDFNNDSIPDIDQPGPLRDYVLGMEGSNFPEYTKKQMAADALFSVLGGSTFVLGGPYSYANRLVKLLKNPNLSKTSKIIRFMPRILGVPTRKEAVEMLKMVTTTPIKWGAKKIWNNFDKRLISNATKILAIIEAAQVGETGEKRKEYLEWVEKERADPQYKDMYDEMFKWHMEVVVGEDPVERITEEDELKSPDVIKEDKKRWEDQPWQLRQMVEDDVEKWLKEHMNKKDKKPQRRGTPKHRTVHGLAYGGDPSDLSSGIAGDDPYFDLDTLDLDLSPFEPIEEMDIFEESKQEVPSIPERKTHDVFQAAKDAGYEEYEVANTVFGKVPGWAIKGLDKVDDLIRGGPQVKNLIRIGDEVAEATKTIGEKSNRFFSNIEAKLLDPDAPKAFDSPADLFNWLNSKGVGKVEIEDYQIPALIETASRMGRPITKEELLLRIKEAPIRKLKTKKLGFGTDAPGKYADQHMEKGYLPGTYRENVLYLDAADIPGDVGKYKHSQHGFFTDKEQKYVIGWTRSSDRPAIIPDVKAITDITDKTKKLQTKIDRMTDITKMSPEEMAAKHNISLDRAKKNMSFAEKELKKAVAKLEEVGKGKAAAGGEQITVTFADEIQSDVFQTYRKHLQTAKKDYEAILARAISPRAKDQIRQMEYADDAYEVATDLDVIGYYDKYKDIMRPMFRTVDDFKSYIDDLTKSQAVFTDFAKIQPGQMTKEQLKLVRAAGKDRDKVLQVFEEAFTSPEVMKKLFPNIPFKDRKAWGDALVKNDLHEAATRLFVTKDANAPTWYSISPEDLIQARYSQTGSTATPLAARTKDMKGIGTSEFYGGPNAVDPNGKHFTSTLEEALRRAARANNSQIKKIKVAVGEPKTKKHTVQVFSEESGNILKEFKVTKGNKDESLASAIEHAKKFIADSPYENINFKAVSTPSGFKTVDAYAIKLTPEMVLPSKTHMAAGGYVHTPFVSIDEVIGAYA